MKKFLTAFVAVLVMFTLAGCVVGGTTDDRLVVTFWHAIGQNNQVAIDKMVKSFEEKYPNIKIEHGSQGSYGDLQTKIQDNLRADKAPVVAQTYPDHVVAYLTSNNAVVDLNQYAVDPEVGFDAMNVSPNNYFENFWDEGKKYDDIGSLYSMPFNKSTEVLMYNKTIFLKYDWFVKLLGYNKDDVYKVYNEDTVNEKGEVTKVGKRELKDEFVWNPTWEEIIIIGEAYKNTAEYSVPEKDANGKDVAVQRYALGYDSAANLMITLTQQFAAKDPDDKYGTRGEGAFVRINPTTNKGEFTFLLDSEKENTYPKQAMEFYKENADKKIFAIAKMLGSEEYCSNYFKSQRIIMTIGSSAGSSYNDGGGFDIGVATYPQFEGVAEEEKQVIQQGTNLTLFAQKDKELEKAGWLWILWLTNYENAELWSTETSYFTSRKDVYESKSYQDYITGKKVTDSGEVYYQTSLRTDVIKVGLSQNAWFFTNDVFNGTSKARDAAEGMVISIMTNQKSFNEALADAKETLKNYITA